MRRPFHWLIFGAVGIYLAVAVGGLEISWARVMRGLPRALEFLGAFLQPNFVTRWADIREGLWQSLCMTVAATPLGIALSIPVALGAASNLAPRPVYLLCRAATTGSRSFQDLIVAILLVKMLGFGPLAGALTLALGTVGFFAKLLAEEIEQMPADTLDALRAAGAGWAQVILFGVVPQVMPRAVGLSLYSLDINFRESTIIGVVGAGGIGATLNTTFDRYEYDSAAAVLLLIIGLVSLCEWVSGKLRRRWQ